MLTLNWFSIALISGSIQGLLLILGLWIKPNNDRPVNKHLIVLLMTIVLSLLLRLSYTNSDYLFVHLPHLMIASDFVIFLLGPMLYLYVKYSIDQKLEWRRQEWLHFLPFFIYLLSTLYFLKYSPQELYQQQSDGNINKYYIAVMGMAIPHIGFYMIRGLQILSRCATADFPIQKKRYLRTILWSLLMVTILWGVGHVYSILPGQVNIAISHRSYQLSFLLMSLLVFIIGYYAIRLPELFSQPIKLPKVKYQNSKLDNTKALVTRKHLIELLEQEHVYLDTELSLKKLAVRLGINQVHLSQVINQEFDKNFYDLINQYRVASFIKKAKLEEYQHLTLIAIAIESGFRSKSSFHKAFKKEMGNTPGQYLKETQT